ncbi:MAG: hypothetical protein SGPRY_013714, partial [Prymnesium sp.]
RSLHTGMGERERCGEFASVQVVVGERMPVSEEYGSHLAYITFSTAVPNPLPPVRVGSLMIGAPRCRSHQVTTPLGHPRGPDIARRYTRKRQL